MKRILVFRNVPPRGTWLALVCVALGSCDGCKEPRVSGATATIGSGSGSGAGSGSSGSGSATIASSAKTGPGSATTGSRSDSTGSTDPDVAAEAARRKGKRTGLGGVDDKPEAIGENLVRAIGSGKAAAKRFIDPKRLVIERIAMPGGGDNKLPEVDKTLCGDAAERRVTAYLKAMVDAEANADAKNLDDGSRIHCSNEFADTDDPEFGANEMAEKPPAAVPMKQVTCWAGEGEWNEISHVVWLPDAERGFRIGAIVSTEGGANTGMLWHEIAVALKAAKPCK